MEYFKEQCCEFRKLWSDRAFWDKTADHRQRAVDAIGYVYLNLAPTSPDDTQFAADIYSSTVNEYQQREIKILFGKLVN